MVVGVNLSAIFITTVLSIRCSNSLILNLRCLALAFCPSFILGIVALYDTKDMKQDPLEQMMLGAMATSCFLYIIWLLLTSHKPYMEMVHSLKAAEFYALSGLMTAVMVEGHHAVGLAFSLNAIALLMFCLRKTAVMSMLTLPLFFLLNYKIILQGLREVNGLSLLILVIILLSEPFLNATWSNLTSLDCWKLVFGKNFGRLFLSYVQFIRNRDL